MPSFRVCFSFLIVFFVTNVFADVQTRVWPSNEYTRFTIESTDYIKNDQSILKNPDRVVIDLKSIKIRKDLELFMLRSENTKLCVEITLSALKKFESKGFFKSNPQKSKGRYYSFMPNVLKEVCLKYFKQHTKSL